MYPYRNVGFSEYNPTQGNQLPKLGLRSTSSNAKKTMKETNKKAGESKARIFQITEEFAYFCSLVNVI